MVGKLWPGETLVKIAQRFRNNTTQNKKTVCLCVLITFCCGTNILVIWLITYTTLYKSYYLIKCINLIIFMILLIYIFIIFILFIILDILEILDISYVLDIRTWWCTEKTFSDTIEKFNN